MSQTVHASRCGRSVGFTLVELLVVIAIIALLLSILMPGLQTAQDLAKRATCRANVSALSRGIHVYASDYQERMPLGYHRIWNCGKQYNYCLCRADNSGNTHWLNFGYLYNAKVLPAPRGLYCPSNDIGMLTYDYHDGEGLSNPWPPESGSATRLGYGTRPVVAWQGWSGPDEPLPRQSELHVDTAMVADVMSSYDHLDHAHQTGVNEGYLDGSAVWV